MASLEVPVLLVILVPSFIIPDLSLPTPALTPDKDGVAGMSFNGPEQEGVVVEVCESDPVIVTEISSPQVRPFSSLSMHNRKRQSPTPACQV